VQLYSCENVKRWPDSVDEQASIPARIADNQGQ
jgi:hypothetical protein